MGYNITKFRKGENVQFTVNCLDRAHAPLDLTGHTVKIAIASTQIGETPAVEFVSPSAQVTIADVANGRVNFDLSAADLNAVPEEGRYFYSIWTDDGSTVIHQLDGRIELQQAVQAT